MAEDALAAKAALIREYDEIFAFRVAAGVIDKPVISVWLVLIPFLFVFYVYRIQKYKHDLPAFAEGVGRSRRVALEATLAALRAGQPAITGEGAVPVAVTGRPLPSAAQAAEAALLAAHYRLLLAARGEDYPALLRAAYPGRDAYEEFLAALRKAEEMVREAAVAALPDQTEATAVAARIEVAVRRLRQEECEKIYG